MPNDAAPNPSLCHYEGEPSDVVIPDRKKRKLRDRLKAYQSCISPEMMASYRREYDNKRDSLQHITFTEYAAFWAENRVDILNQELVNIRGRHFGFPIMQRRDHLVEFYTGLPNCSQFYFVNSLLQRLLYRIYIDWEVDEKHGFLNHTLMTLMKLRLNMPDEEVAERFGIEPYVVKMTLRFWLPGLYRCVYKYCEGMFSGPPNNDLQRFTKVVDVVEVCFETPDYTRRHRGNQHEAKKAVLCVRNDGLVAFASSVVSANRPDADTITRSGLGDTCSNGDIVAVHPELLPTVAAMEVRCHQMSPVAEYYITEAVTRLRVFRILMAIPEEYKTFHEYIFPVCAALSNFFLDDREPNLDEEMPEPHEH